MKKPAQEERQLRCARKRRYRTQGDALDAALLAGVERQRTAYLCPLCRHWHLTSRQPSPTPIKTDCPVRSGGCTSASRAGRDADCGPSGRR